MKGLAVALLLVLAGCAHRVDDGVQASEGAPPHHARGGGSGGAPDASADAGGGGGAASDGAGAASDGTGDASDGTGDAAGGGDDASGGAPANDDASGAPASGDEHADGPPGAPATAHDSCVVADDCAPASDVEQPGFSCIAGVCQCDPDGSRASSCSASGGQWSAFECACFQNTDSAMPQSAPPTPSAADDDITCWWVYRETSCDGPVWVDTSYYDYECVTSDDCSWVYVDDGYYEDGDCHYRWVSRCDNGYEYW